jgi:Integrin beta chain VWA domain
MRPSPLRPARLFVALALLAAGCGSNTNVGPPGGGVDAAVDAAPHTLLSVVVTPTNQILELDLNTAGSQAFTATGIFLDGVSEDLTAQATWSSSNPAAGTLAGATLMVPAFTAVAAETSRITATFEGKVGEAQITVVAYRQTGPATDFFFVLPYEDPMGPRRKPLQFSTAIPELDVFFLMDTTGSMFGSITNLQNALTNTIIPGIRAAVTNSQFGVGAYEDFPVLPYGSLMGSACGRGGLSTPDQPFHLFQTITNDAAMVQTGVGRLRTATGPIGCGQDWPESGIEGLYQAATGDGLTGPAPTSVPANHTGVGGVAFRPNSMPVIVQISDAMSHGPGETRVCAASNESANYAGAVATAAHTRAQTKAALGAICGRVVGVSAVQAGALGLCSSQADLEDFATSTGALVPPAAWDVGVRPAGCAANQCCTGANGVGRAPNAQGLCPVVFLASPDGSGLANNIVTGIRMLTRFATFDVTSERMGGTADTDGMALPTPHTTADFIHAVTPTGFMLPPPPPNLPDPTFDATQFRGVTPGTKVNFDVEAFNDFLPAGNAARIFRASIQVLAGGCTPLDTREVLILVPPEEIIIN